MNGLHEEYQNRDQKRVMALLLKRISMFFVLLPFLLLAAEVWLKYPSNHGGSVFEYANVGFVALFVNMAYMFFSRRLAICRILAFVFFFVLLYACDRFNVLVQYEEWIARGMPDWGGAAKMNWSCDITFAAVVVLSFAFFGCGQERQRHEFVNTDGLRPTTFQELVAMNREQVDRVDIGRMNLICANEASHGVDIGVERLLGKLDEWAEHCRKEEMRFRKKFEKNPKRYDGSYAKFKAINLVLTIKEDFNCRYQMSLVRSGEMAKINSPAFFRNYDDAFVSGLLRKRRGTCSSYPVLIAALGRRLGYPISLKATFGHMFCEWDDGVERFNIDTNGEGVDTPSDDWYLKGNVEKAYGIKTPAKDEGYYMQPLGNWECLGLFIETIGYCHEANGRMDKAIEAYNLARRYLPNSENLRRLAARRVMPKEVFDQIQETLRFNEEQRRRLSGAVRKEGN